LKALDREITALIGPLSSSQRVMVTNHDSLEYFAEHYGLDIVGTVLPSTSTLTESSPAELESLAETLEQEGISVIFADSDHSSDEADAVAQRLGDVSVIALQSGSLGEPGSDSDTYLGFMRTNARDIVAGLSGTQR
jgi:zinc/manganese transport system substrate-binding protein